MHGGARPGAGRKPKPIAEKMLHGTALLKEKRAIPAELQPFDPGDDLNQAEMDVWNVLAPLALKARTLTPAMSYAFKLLCRNIVMERELSRDPDSRAGQNHRGIIQRIESALQAFGLRPMGKPILEDAPKVEDPFAQFEGKPSVDVQ